MFCFDCVEAEVHKACERLTHFRCPECSVVILPRDYKPPRKTGTPSRGKAPAKTQKRITRNKATGVNVGHAFDESTTTTLFQPKRHSTFFEDHNKHISKQLAPSSKLVDVVKLVLKWLSEHPD